MIDRAERDLFLLVVLLIVAAYYVGVSTDLNSLMTGITNLVNVASGRNSKGQFANYPGGS